MTGEGKRRGGFTLIELLVVIAVIAVLMSILMPSLRGAREQARRSVCLNHIGSVGKLVIMYAQDNDDRLPEQRGSLNIGGVHDKGSNYYSYIHTGTSTPDRQGFDGLGYLYKTKLLPNESDLPFCPSYRQAFGQPKTMSDQFRNAKGNAAHRNYVGPNSSFGYGFKNGDEWLGWLNLRWSWGWRNLEEELKIKKLSQTKSSYVYASDLWAAGGKSEHYWKTRYEDIPHRTGRTVSMNAWYLGGNAESHRWDADTYFDDVASDSTRFLNRRYNWRILFEGKTSPGSNRPPR